MIDEEEKTQPPVEENEEVKPQEKIGFSNPGYTPSFKKLKEKDIAYSTDKKTPFARWTYLIFVIAMVTSSTCIAYFFAPIFGALVGVVLFLLVFTFTVVSVICTLGISLISDEFRAFLGAIWQVPMWFFDVSNHLAALAGYFLIPAIIAVVFGIASTVLCFIGVANKKGRYVTYLVFSILVTVVVFAFIIVYFGSGMMIFNSGDAVSSVPLNS